jgi:putative transcriptional regulator
MTSAKKAPPASDLSSVPESSIAFSADHLANQFLIAMPGMADPNFAGTVIYLFEHTDRGAMGLVVNRPTEVDLATLFDKIELKLEIAPLLEQPVYFGGPVQVERGFVLHEPNPGTSYSSSLIIPGGLTMTTSKDVLEAVASGNGPRKFLMTLGYAGWGAGQLEEEITLNGWMNVPLSRQQMAEIIFDTPYSQRYERAMSHLGFDLSHLSGEAGHA